MNVWSLALLFGAIIALALTYKTPRAWLWIGLGAASFAASTLVWEYGDKTFHPLFTFTCDALFCLALHLRIRQQWEVGILFLYIVSVFVSLMKLGGFMPDGIMYAAMLEGVNWLALLWIGGIGLTDLASRYDVSFIRRMHTGFHRSRHSGP